MWNHLLKMVRVGGRTMPRFPCQGHDPIHRSTGNLPLRFLSAWHKTHPLNSKITLDVSEREGNRVGGTVIGILPIGSKVYAGEMVAMVEKVKGVNNCLVPVIAPHLGRITQWYAQPSKYISIGEPLLELDNDLSLQQDLEASRHNPHFQDQVAEEKRLVLEVFEKNFITQHLERHISDPYKQSQIHTEWGDVRRRHKDYQGALENYLQALQWLKKTYPSGRHPHMFITHFCIGQLYQQLENWKEAVQHIQSGLELWIQHEGHPCHPNIALGYLDIGELHLKMSNYDGAKKNFELALEICHKLSGSDPIPIYSAAVAGIHRNLGEVLRRMKEFESAHQQLQKAMKLYTEALGKNHPDTASCHFVIGLVWKSQGELDLAKQEFQKAREIWIEAHGSDHPDVEMAAQKIKDCESS